MLNKNNKLMKFNLKNNIFDFNIFTNFCSQTRRILSYNYYHFNLTFEQKNYNLLILDFFSYFLNNVVVHNVTFDDFINYNCNTFTKYNYDFIKLLKLSFAKFLNLINFKNCSLFYLRFWELLDYYKPYNKKLNYKNLSYKFKYKIFNLDLNKKIKCLKDKKIKKFNFLLNIIYLKDFKYKSKILLNRSLFIIKNLILKGEMEDMDIYVFPLNYSYTLMYYLYKYYDFFTPKINNFFRKTYSSLKIYKNKKKIKKKSKYDLINYTYNSNILINLNNNIINQSYIPIYEKIEINRRSIRLNVLHLSNIKISHIIN